jgi:hypothetical protein
LSREEKFEINKDNLFDPFSEEAKNAPSVDPFQKKLYNNWENGTYLLCNPFNLDYHYKMVVKDNKIIKMYDLDENFEFKLREDG